MKVLQNNKIIMGKEGMSSSAGKQWKNPHAEAVLINAEKSIPWSDQIEKAEKGERIAEILNDLNVVDAIEEAGYPTDEEACDRIGEKNGLGAAEVAVLSRRLREKEENRVN